MSGSVPDPRLPDTAVDDEGLDPPVRDGDKPGLAVVFGPSGAVLRRIPLVGGYAVVGRVDAEDDALVSREHVEVRLTDGQWRVRDLNSRNGTYVDGERVVGEQVYARPPSVVRI